MKLGINIKPYSKHPIVLFLTTYSLGQ